MINKSDIAGLLKVSLTTLSRYAIKYGAWAKGDRRKKIPIGEARSLLEKLGYTADEI